MGCRFYNDRDGSVSDVGILECTYRFFDGWSRWHNLRAIGGSRVSLLTLLAPIFGYLILFNPEFGDFFEVWKSYCFYLGSILFFVANQTYSIWCPGQCKKYDTAVDYANAEVEFFTAHQEILLHALRRHLIKLRLPKHVFVDRKSIELLRQKITADPEAMPNKLDTFRLMEFLWHLLDPSRKFARYSCFVCYRTGGLLIVFPAFYQACEIIGRWI